MNRRAERAWLNAGWITAAAVVAAYLAGIFQ